MGKSTKRARRPKQPADAPKLANGRYYAYAALVVVVVLFAAIRFRLRAMPLERDEGEYAYTAQLMLQGIPPYELAYTMKLPGTPAAYAAIMAVFGQTPSGIHLGLMLVGAATTLLVYLLAARLSGRLAGVAAAAAYAVLSTSFSVLGLAAHATHFVALCAVAGILNLLRAINNGRLREFFAGGFLLGLAFLMKQPGIAFAVFGGLYLVWSEWKQPIAWRSLLSKVGSYGSGVALPFAATCLILAAAGVFTNFRFWVFKYAGQYTSENDFNYGLEVFTRNFPRVVGAGVGVWIIAAVGLCSLLWHGESRRHGILAGGLLFFSFLAVCPALFFRDHYFILMLPAVALLAGLGVHAATQALARRGGLALAAIPVLVFSAACGYALVEQRAFLLEKDPVVVCEERYSTNPFPEAVVVAQYLNAHTAADEPIAVLGSEPEIYFYAKRHSATGFIYLYGLMEEQKYAYEMQRQMIGEVEAAQPKYLVVAKNRLSWMAHEGSPQAVAMSAWLGSFLAGYELVGVVERVGDHIAYHWDDDARAYEPHSQNILGVFRRKS